MPSPVDALQAAGFNNDEIAAWSTERRKVLSDGGFADNEIDAYFTGGVVAPTQVPRALEDRITAGEEAAKREGGLLQTLPQFGHLVSTPEGRGKLWEAVKQYPSKFLADMVETAQTPGDVAAGRIDLTTEDGLDRALGLGTLVGLGRFSKINKTGKTSGLALGMGDQVARVERTPTGEVFDHPVGALPNSADFLTAARSIHAGETTIEINGQRTVIRDGQVVNEPVGPSAPAAPLSTQEKLLKVYEEQGRLPAEVAHDAQTDPVVAQRMLSKDPADLPYIEGEPPIPPEPPGPAAPAEPPAPPPGSLAEAQAKVLDKISIGEADRARPYTFSRLYRETIDDLHPLKAVSEDAYQMARLTRGSFGKAEQFLERSTFDFKTLKDNGRPLKEILAPVADDMNGLRAYLAAKRAIEIEAPKSNAPAAGTIRLYRGEGGGAAAQPGQAAHAGSNMTGGWFTTDLEKAKLYGDVSFVDVTRDDLKHFVGGHGGPDEFVTDNPAFRNKAKPLTGSETPSGGRKSGIDLEAAQRVVDQSPKELGRIGERLVNYQNRVLAYLRDSGVISGKSFDAMVEAGKAYVPFYRLMGEETGGKGAGSSLGPGNPVKRLKGSEREIIDPLESIIKNTYAYISIAERNAAGIELVEALKKQGFEVKEALTAKSDAETMAYLKEQGVTTPEALRDFVQHALPETGDTISAMRDGKRLEVTVDDPELVAAFRGMDRGSVGLLTKVFSVPASMLRAGAVLTPEYMARNLDRDLLTAFINSKGLFTPIDTAKGLVGIIRRDADYQNWVKGGGANSTFVALDRAYMQESLTKLAGETGLMNRSWNVISYVPPFGLKGLRFLAELTENATRLGEFKKVLEGRTSKEAIQEAAFAAREVTQDFAKMGAKMRAYNMLTAFAAAQIGGVDRIVQAFRERPVNTLAKVAGGITLPSVLLWWANHDDPRYQELPAWQRDLFWIIPTDKWEPISPADAAGKPAHLIRQRGDQTEFNNGSIWRIPKPFELGVIFGSGPERALDALVGNDPEAFKGFTKSMIEVLTPSFIPTAVQPLFEQYANRSTFTDRTLIPADVEKQLPEYQSTPYTTELSKKLGQVFSAFPGMRNAATDPGNPAGPTARALTTPILIENYVRSWTGGLGMYAMQAADASLRKAGVLPDPIKPTATLADIPFVRAFAVRYPSATAESIQDFHDDYAQNKRFFDTWQAKAREGDVVAMGRIQAAGGPMMFVQLEGINQALSEHSKLVRDVYKNPTMPADQKRQLIDSMYFNMIQIAKGGRQIMKQAQVGLTGGPQPPQ